MINDDLERKPVVITDRCFEMLDKAVKYLKDNYAETQAEIMNNQFFKATELLEIMPGLGTKYKKGMRKILLGKFPYYIYYREHKDYTSVRGIWHTSRGKEFEDDIG